jgi:hypothetical protein
LQRSLVRDERSRASLLADSPAWQPRADLVSASKNRRDGEGRAGVLGPEGEFGWHSCACSSNDVLFASVTSPAIQGRDQPPDLAATVDQRYLYADRLDGITASFKQTRNSWDIGKREDDSGVGEFLT